MARFFMSAICSNSVLGRVKLSRTTLTFFSLAGFAGVTLFLGAAVGETFGATVGALDLTVWVTGDADFGADLTADLTADLGAALTVLVAVVGLAGFGAPAFLAAVAGVAVVLSVMVWVP